MPEAGLGKQSFRAGVAKQELRDEEKAESYRIIGACFDVYKEKGNGFLEAVYQECLARELAAQEIPFEEKPRVS